MSERQSVEVDLDKLRARMLRGPITEEQIDLLFALIETARDQAAKAEIGRLAWTAIGARGEAVATAAAIVRHELERDGLIQPHTRSLLSAALDAYEAAKARTE